MTQVSQLLRAGVQLDGISDTPQLDAEILLCHVLEVDRSWLRTWPEAQIDAVRARQYQQLLARRIQGHPIAHLIGSQGFWSLDLMVSPDTLIPRPETELLVEMALGLALPRDAQVLDLGTGTGAIALVLASERQSWQITASDIEAKVVTLAEKNRQRHNLHNVQILQSDWFANLAGSEGRFNLIVSNPPYIQEGDVHLSQGDVRFEPASALVSGAEGLNDLQILIARSRDFLQRGGWLLVEHGFQQAESVRQLFSCADFIRVTTETDYNGCDRVTLGQLP